MNCSKFHNLLDDHLLGALGEADRVKLEAHAAACASCRAAFADAQQFASQLGQLMQDETKNLTVHPHLQFKVRASLAAKPSRRNVIKESLMKVRIIEVVLSIAIVGILATISVPRFGRHKAQPSVLPYASIDAELRKKAQLLSPPLQREWSLRDMELNPLTANASSVKFNTENYATINDNRFLEAKSNPLSTFSIDVDTASYANMRRFIMSGTKPPKDAVRIEEMINYFTYDYPQPTNEHPFSVTTEAVQCPWNKGHSLVLIGLQGKRIPMEALPPNNIVFLLDVSGSMNMPNKLPLVKSAFKMLARELRPNDRVAIVVYAGAAGMVLDSTSGDKKDVILGAIEQLQAGGSTAGGAGLQLAYKVAKENFIKDGNNRVILATDGDFNIGASSDAEMVRLIEEKRKDGIYISVLGFGEGNLKDSKMEQIADKGNGNYSYIDSVFEAKKVLVSELGGTLLTIAKDVKLQIEFNPSVVKAYRLIGYENRLLAKEDFNDDTKDAGEMGAGHSATALYELVPADSTQTFSRVDDLKYQTTAVKESSDMMTVKLRYKKPDSDSSILLSTVLDASVTNVVAMPGNLAFASAVAEYGMLLRDSEFKGVASYESLIARAKTAKGKDDNGTRAEFIRLAEQAEMLK